MAAKVKRDLDARVPQMLLDRLNVRAALMDQQGCACVTEIAESQPGQFLWPDTLDQSLDSGAEMALVEGRTWLP